eukprot:EST47224.1 Hypothetical protein SS50377_12735 [Spironucleus salmonicida]
MKFQAPILGITGIQSCIFQQNKLINNGTCDLIIKDKENSAKILKIQEISKSSEDVLFWPVYAQKMQIEGTDEHKIAVQFGDVLEFMQKCIQRPKQKEMVANAVGSELMETIEYSEAVLPIAIILKDQQDMHLCKDQPVQNIQEVTQQQNDTLQRPNETIQIVNIPQSTQIQNQISIEQQYNTLQEEEQPGQIFNSDESIARNSVLQQESSNNYKSEYYDLNKNTIQFSANDDTSSILSKIQNKNVPKYILDQYQQELQELNALEQQLNSRGYQDESIYDQQYDQKNYIYETEVIPEFMPVTVQFIDGELHYTPQNLIFVNDVPIYPILYQNTYWRTLNSQFTLSTPKFPPYNEKISEQSTAQILYLTGQIHIQNTSHQSGFHQKISSIYPEQSDQVAQMASNMQYLYFNIDFITQQQEYSNFRINIKSDDQLSGRLDPSETRIINITFAITITNVENDALPELPQLFQNMIYNTNSQNMESITPLFIRITGFRFDRYYSDEEFDCLPAFYQLQNDDEIRESIDIPVVFPSNLIADRKVEKSVQLNQIRYPQGDLRINQNIGKVTQAFNMQFFDFLKTLPIIGLNDVNNIGSLKLKNQPSVPKVVKQANQIKKLDKYLTNNKQGGVMSFSPVSNNKKSVAKTPKHNDIFIENTEQQQLNKFELEKSYPIIFKKKSIDFKQISVQELDIFCYPTNLPRCSEELDDFPILSHAFTCNSTSLKVKTSTLFLSNDYTAGYIDFKFKLSQKSVDSIIESLVLSQRMPIFLEQQFCLEIKSDGANSALAKFPILVRAELDLDEFQFKYANPGVSGTNMPIRNAIQGINLRQINGFVEEIFATTQVVKCPPVFYMSKTKTFLELFNGSGRSIVAFTQGSAPPFKCVNTFQISSNSSFKQEIEFAPKKPGKYEFDMKVQWPDNSKVKEIQQGGKGIQRYHNLNVKVVAIAVNVPLLLKQSSEDFPKTVKINKYQFSMLYIQNISNQNAKFSFDVESNLQVSPSVGVVEPGASAVVRIWFEGEKRPSKIKVLGECFGATGIVFDGVGEPE